MRVQTEEWHRFIPGVRMYKGKMTYFYNGEILFDHPLNPLIYNREERDKWQVIIVLPGVQIIPWGTFTECYNVETVIMADTVTRIGIAAFSWCRKLAFVRLSRNLEYIGHNVFDHCKSLTAIFIPDSCREIGNWVFYKTNLVILVVPPHTELGQKVIESTPLLQKSPQSIGEVNAWVKSINDNGEYALHRLCSSMDPSEDEIYEMICDQGGLHAMAKTNSIGITPSEYLASNPFADVDEMKLMKRFILENMGEVAITFMHE